MNNTSKLFQMKSILYSMHGDLTNYLLDHTVDSFDEEPELDEIRTEIETLLRLCDDTIGLRR